MTANVYNTRVTVQVKTTVLGALGETVVWKPVGKKYAAVVPLSVRARADFQQLHSEATHEVKFRGTVSLALGNNRLLWKDKTLDLVEPPRELDGSTVVVVKEA